MIDSASEAVTDEVGVGLFPQTIVPSPDGSRVYVVNNGSSQISVIDTATDSVLGKPTDVGARPFGAAITADGRRLLVVGSEAKQAQAIDTVTMTPVGGTIALGGYAEGMAIVPAQTPVPEFSALAATAGAASTFDAAGSHVYDGRVARYDWDFGDGTSAVDAGPTPAHTYAKPGEYVVTLTVSNGQGCPGFVSTGGTAICAGPSTSSTVRSVSVGGSAVTPPAPAVGSETRLPARIEPTSPGAPGATAAYPRSVRVHCPASAGPQGCKLMLQIVSGRPKKLANGKLRLPRPEGPVAKANLVQGKSRLIPLRVRPKFAARLAAQSRVFVKRTRVIRGRARTDFPRLAFVG